MKNDGFPIAKEGFPFLLVALAATVAFALGGVWQAVLVGSIVTAYIAYFFRNPERLAPVGSHIVAAPADGKIVYVGPAVEPDFLKEEMQKVSIFMSLLDVHVNRVPVDGTVQDMVYHRGRFMAASEDRASEENERNALLIETSRGERLVLVQVAGLVAQRIVCYLTKGSFVLKGQRMGLIRFGSRCDLYLPKDAEVLVQMGEKVFGGESIVAKLREAAPAQGEK